MLELTLLMATWLSRVWGSFLPVIKQGQQPLQTVQSCGPFNSYTALGDSYAGGYGSEKRLPLCPKDENEGTRVCTSEHCGKDTGGYPYRFASNIPNFQYLACDGDATWQIRDNQVNNDAAFGRPDLITVGGGGDNNNIFSDMVRACIFINTYTGSYNSPACDDAIKAAKIKIQNLPADFDDLFSAIQNKVKSQNTNATVVVMSYAQFWGQKAITTDVCSTKLSFWNWFSVSMPANSSQKQKMNELAIELNDAMKTKAMAFGFKYADIDRWFEGHRLCDDFGVEYSGWFRTAPHVEWPTWTTYIVEDAWAHPTLDGQKAYEGALREVLGC